MAWKPSMPDLQPRTWFTVGNLVAGVSVGAYLIPQAMAYGSLAGVGPAMGLATAIVPLLVYAALGSHIWMSVGPESAVAMMAAAAVAPVGLAVGMEPAALLPTMAVIVGIALIVGRFLKASFLADLLSLPVLVGYLTGIAILMVMSQIYRLTGIDADTTDIRTLFTNTDWHAPNWATLGVGLIVAAVAWGAPKISPRFPGALLALGLSIVLGYLVDIPTIGPVTSAMPTFGVPTLSMDVVSALLWPAISVAAVAFADVTVTGRAITDGTRPNTKREMLAIGGSQLATGFFSGYPVSASSSRTALARASGATSRHYSLVVAVVIILAPLLLGGVLSRIPQAGLAGIILFAAISLLEPAQWRKLARLHKNETLIAASCTVVVLVFGILPGIAFAIGMSVIAFLARLARPTASVLGFTPMSASMHSVDTHDDTDTVPGLVVFRYEAPLFFINAPDFFDEAMDVVDPETDVLLINMEASANLDVTSLDTLAELNDTLRQRGVDMWLARVRYDVMELMEKHGVLEDIGREHVYETLTIAVDAFRTADMH